MKKKTIIIVLSLAILVSTAGVFLIGNFLELGYGLSYGSGFQPKEEPERIRE